MELEEPIKIQYLQLGNVAKSVVVVSTDTFDRRVGYVATRKGIEVGDISVSGDSSTRPSADIP